MPLDLRARFFASIEFTSFDGAIEWGFALVFFGIVGLACYGAWSAADRRRAVRWGGLAAMMLVGYFVAPHSAAGILFFHARLLPFAFVFALLAAPSAPRMPRALLGAVIAFVALVTAHDAFVFARFDEEARGAVGCIGRARRGSTLAGLMTHRDPRVVRYPLFLHIDSYHTAWNLGPVMNSLVVESGPSTVLRHKVAPFRGVTLGVEERPDWFDYEKTGPDVDYFLMHGPKTLRVGGVEQSVDAALLRRGHSKSRLVCEMDGFRLYEHVR